MACNKNLTVGLLFTNETKAVKKGIVSVYLHKLLTGSQEHIKCI